MTDRPLVYKATLHKLKVWEYNAIRSFVESSTKPVYEWNQCIEMPDELSPQGYVVIECEKPNEWRLTIFKPRGESKNKMLLATLSENFFATVLEADILPSGIDKVIVGDYTFEPAKQNVTKAILFIPEDRVPHARPITLSEVISKLEFYRALL